MLLNDEQLANLNASAAPQVPTNKHVDGQTEAPTQDLWNDEEDDFFGHSAPPATAFVQEGDENGAPIATSTRGKKRRSGATGAPRGRKPTGKKRGAAAEVPFVGEIM